VTGKPAAIVYARGGAYPANSPEESLDLQKRYVDTILGFIGFTDLRPIIIEPTLMLGNEDYSRMIDEKITQAREVAAKF